MLTFWNGLLPVELLCDATPEFVRMIDALPNKKRDQNSYLVAKVSFIRNPPTHLFVLNR
jgi:hypothetical protein